MLEVSALFLGEWLRLEVSPYFAYVTDAERRSRLERYRSPEGRSRSLFAELFARWRLARAAGVEPAAVRLIHDKAGAPVWAGGGLYVSLSHSGGYVAVGIGDGPLGVDVECRRRIGLDIARRWFRPKEYDYLRALPPEAQRRQLLRFWTLKESALKRTGAGLAGGLDSVDCRALIEAGRSRLDDDVPAGRSFSLPGDDVLSVVAPRASLPETVRLFHIARRERGVYGGLAFEERAPLPEMA